MLDNVPTKEVGEIGLKVAYEEKLNEKQRNAYWRLSGGRVIEQTWAFNGEQCQVDSSTASSVKLTVRKCVIPTARRAA